MKKLLFCLFFIISTCLLLSANDSVQTKRTVVVPINEQIYHLQQENINDKISYHDKRIEEVQGRMDNQLTFISIGVAFLALVITFILGMLIYKVVGMDNEAKEAKSKYDEIKAIYGKAEELKQKLEGASRQIDKTLSQATADAQKDAQEIKFELKGVLLEIDKSLKAIKDNEHKAKVSLENTKKHEARVQDLTERLVEGERSDKLTQEVKEVSEELRTTKTLSEYTANDWFLRGVEARQNQQYEDAVYYYRKSLELKASPVTYNNLGFSYNELGDYGKAIDALRKSIELNETLAYPHRHLGVALSAKGQYKEAVEEYETAIKLRSSYTKAFISWDEILEKMKKAGDKFYDEALERFKKVLTANKDNEKLKEDETFKEVYKKYMS